MPLKGYFPEDCGFPYFCARRYIGTDINDRFVGVGGMVLGQLNTIHQGALGQVILPELGLKQKVSGIGVILEDAGDGTLVPGVHGFAHPLSCHIGTEISPGPGAYSPGYLCEFAHEAPHRCPTLLIPEI